MMDNIKTQEQSPINEETVENIVPELQTRPLIKRLYEKSNEERKKSNSNVLNKSNIDSNKSLEKVVSCKVEPIEEAPENSQCSLAGDRDNNNENSRLEIKTEWEDLEANIKQEPPDYHSSDDESQLHDDEDPEYGVVSPPKKSKPTPKARKRKIKKKSTKEAKEDSSDQSPVKEWEVELDIPQEIKIGVPDRRRTVKLISEEEASSSCVVPTTSAAAKRKELKTELAPSDSESDVDFIDEFSDSDSVAYPDSDDEIQIPVCPLKWAYKLSTPLKRIPFTKRQGLLINLENKNPIDFFSLLVDDQFLLLTLKQINFNLAKVKKENSGLKNAEELTLFEMHRFLAVLLNIGIIRIQELDMYWREGNEIFNFSWFRQQMTYKRFILILGCLEYADSKYVGSSEDALSSMRPIIDYFNSKMQEVYYPAKELVLNQSFLISRRRLLSRDFLNHRLKKYGLKLYHLTEPNGLNLKLAVTTINVSNFNVKPTTQTIAKYLLKDYLNAGHAVYMHYHYTSVDLAQHFLQNNTYCTGMLCQNRENNPVEVTLAKLTKGQYRIQYADGMTVGKFYDILFLSTEFDGSIVSTKNKRGMLKTTPDAVVNFMKYMATIDRNEQLLSCYSCANNRLPWKVKVFIHVLEMLMINAYLLFKKHVDKNMEFYKFRLKIINKLNTEKRIQTPMRGNENNV